MNFISIGFTNTQSSHLERLERLCPTRPKELLVDDSLDRIFSRSKTFFPIIIQSGVSNHQIKKIFSILGGVFLITLILSTLLSSSVPLFAIPIAIILAVLYLLTQRKLRAKKFEADYPTFLLSLASAVRTGIDPLDAIIRCRELFDSESILVKELDSFKELLETDSSVEEVLLQFGRTIHHPDLPLFRSALLLSIREGGTLSTCLYRLARVTRQRQSFRRRVRSAIALQKISALGILFCAGTLVAIQLATNYAAFAAAYDHPVGKNIIRAGFSLMFTGAIWLMYMTREKSQS